MKVKDYENYEVRPNGEVINIKTGRVLKPRKNNNGYLHVSLYKNGEPKQFQIHRLVAEAFIPNPENLPEVNHRDEDKTNNSVDNLEWCTHEYNMNYGFRIKKVSDKLSKPVYQYSLDGTFVKEWSSTRKVQKQLGYSQGNISACCRGERKTSYGFRWCYKK